MGLSDVHLGTSESDKELFMAFLDEPRDNVERLTLVDARVRRWKRCWTVAPMQFLRFISRHHLVPSHLVASIFSRGTSHAASLPLPREKDALHVRAARTLCLFCPCPHSPAFRRSLTSMIHRWKEGGLKTLILLITCITRVHKNFFWPNEAEFRATFK